MPTSGEKLSPSQALASGLAASLSVFNWEPSFYHRSTSGLITIVKMDIEDKDKTH